MIDIIKKVFATTAVSEVNANSSTTTETTAA